VLEYLFQGFFFIHQGFLDSAFVSGSVMPLFATNSVTICLLKALAVSFDSRVGFMA
jgi:hypothetical protein